MTNPSGNPSNFFLFDNDLDEEVANLFSASSALAIDTEAMGLIHGRDRICLVQICDEKDNVACVRIALGQTSAPKLKLLLESLSIEKVFHFARFDIAALKNGLQIEVSPIFCTKVASKLARTYTPRHGLKDLISELVGVELDKKSQSSDWGRVEELTNDQMLYAANDVRYLLLARKKLTLMLQREGRLELAKRCFQTISVMSDLDIMHFGQIFEH
tara:strand:+ start:384 stop:1028 length:645 start_codon:yes stop_codon:yes gene_type:complete